MFTLSKQAEQGVRMDGNGRKWRLVIVAFTSDSTQGPVSVATLPITGR